MGQGTRLQRASEHGGETSEPRVTLQVEEMQINRGEDGGQRSEQDPGHGSAEFEDDVVDDFEDEGELETEAERVETGDTYVVYTDRPEHGDRFFLVLCDKPVHKNGATFTDGWGCKWPRDTMLISGTYYRRIPSVGRDAGSYRYELLEDEPKAWNYSHLVVQSTVELMQYKSSKKNPRFKMTPETRETILSNVEERQMYHAH